MTSTTPAPAQAGGITRMPLGGLLALATAGFLGIINETVPAGLLPEMAHGLGVSASAAGQTISSYALATALAAIPLGVLLRNRGRRTVLVWGLVAFILANAAIFLFDDFMVVLIARFLGGIGSALIWSNLSGIAARLVPERLQSRAVAIALVGMPIALSVGVPAGTFLGREIGWRATFGAAAVLGIALIAWAFASLPNLPGMPDGGHVPIGSLLRARGVRHILFVVAGFMVAHNVLYSYIGPLAASAGAAQQLEWMLLVFGVAALLSVWLTGALVDPHHRRLLLTSTVLVGASALALAFASSPALLYVSVGVWGLGFGGSATLFVAAGFRAAGTDAVQAVIVTVINLSIAAAGVLGGLLLAGAGIRSIPWAAFAIMVPTIAAALWGKRHAFPDWRRQS